MPMYHLTRYPHDSLRTMEHATSSEEWESANDTQALTPAGAMLEQWREEYDLTQADYVILWRVVSAGVTEVARTFQPATEGLVPIQQIARRDAQH